MLRTISAFERLGEENAFAVLARANALIAQGATSSISASGSRIFARPISSSKRPSRHCATVTTATRQPPAFRRCARRLPPTCTNASALLCRLTK